MDVNPIVVTALAIVNLPLLLFLGKVLFGGWEGLWNAVKFWITPDVISLFRGEFWKDFDAELYLAFYVFLCVGLIAGEYWLISRFFEL